MYGFKVIDKLIHEYEFNTVLDIGCGKGLHSKIFKLVDKDVTGVDICEGDHIKGDYMDTAFDTQFDLIWLCHVLEHQNNIGNFLSKIFNDLKDGGILAITVPPLKHSIVGGHVCLWNAGLLLYNLILAGFDCSEARIKQYDYNISIIVEKKKAKLPALLHDHGDINRLSCYFPNGLKERFDGNITELNWENSGRDNE